jgi:hypothetical protein
MSDVLSKAGMCAGMVFLLSCGGDGPSDPGAAHNVTVSPGSVTFGALGSTRQLAATVREGTTVVTGATVTWSQSGSGAVATVNATGLVTAVAPGTDTAIATFAAPSGGGDVTARVPIVVTQLVRQVTVSSAGGAVPDTLFTTTRTRQFTAAATDSNGNAVAGAGFAWTSNNTGAATVNGSGLATAVGDGTAQIRATSGTITGARPLVVRRFAATFTPPAAGGTIDQGQTLALNGAAQDSVGTALPVTWRSRSTSVAAPNPRIGTSTQAYGVGGGATRIVMEAGTRSDSVTITVNATGLVISFAADIQPVFTSSCAVSACHTTPSPAGGLNLTAGVARANLVGVAAVGSPAPATRVIAGNADDSYLIRKLEGGPNILGAQMPESSAPLTPSQIGMIRAWIVAGASNN